MVTPDDRHARGTRSGAAGIVAGFGTGVALMIAAIGLQARIEWRFLDGWGTLLVALAVGAALAVVAHGWPRTPARFGRGIVMGCTATLGVCFLWLAALGLMIGS